MKDAAATLRAYERWAPTYAPVAHNPLMRTEQLFMLQQWPQVGGRRVLDLACGSGRYANLLTAQAAKVVALDFSPGMLSQVSAGNRVCADMMRLPFVAGAFDVVICGLAVGHAADIVVWMSEIARVLAPRGELLYSDFHPEAARAGLTRSFKDQSARKYTVPHRTYAVDIHERAAAEAGLTIEAVQEVRAGIELHEPFPGSGRFYRRWHGLPIVLIVRARK